MAASGAGSLVVHLLVAAAIYIQFADPAKPAVDPPTVEVALVSPDELPKPPDPVEPPKPEVKVEPPKPPPQPAAQQPPPPKPPEPDKQKPPPFKADPSQVIPATRDKATPPQGNQATPTTAKRESENPDKPDTQNADKAPPTPDPDQTKPDEPKQADIKPEPPKPTDPDGIQPQQVAPKPTPQKQAIVQPNKPPPSKQTGASSHRVMAPLTVRPDQFNGRVGRSDIPSYPSTARANGLEGRVVLDVLLTREGLIRRVNIVKSSGYDELDESAVRAVWLWHFQPIGVMTIAEDWVEIPVDFRLH